MRSQLMLSATFLVLPQAALAHIGHWAPVAGHDHIAIGITIGIAVVTGLTILGQRGKDQRPAEETIDDEPAEGDADT